jgi:hypothetical protein
MTTSIDRDAREHAVRTPEAADSDPGRSAMIMRGVRVFTAMAGAASIALVAVGIAQPSIHTSVAAAAALLLAAAGGSLLVAESMLADRQEFYRRGQLEGWRRGWNGEPPEVDDPLLRQ